ncbi:hypothetical protein [Microvirga yunnanensis]|uniref:hypothetical protein n=1 Tax=Microvirga yunnanensis TaxID=2953740 RepID=UPI0021C8C573|nr:hypothetical protein [Microvirga sp. HBU65207]
MRRSREGASDESQKWCPLFTSDALASSAIDPAIIARLEASVATEPASVVVLRACVVCAAPADTHHFQAIVRSAGAGACLMLLPHAVSRRRRGLRAIVRPMAASPAAVRARSRLISAAASRASSTVVPAAPPASAVAAGMSALVIAALTSTSAVVVTSAASAVIIAAAGKRG